MSLLLHINGDNEARWAERLRAYLNVPVWRRDENFDPEAVRYLLVRAPDPDAFDGLDGLEAVLSHGAGVELLMAHPKLPDVPVVRFVDDDLSVRMSDYVVAQVAMHHRLYSTYRAAQIEHRWLDIHPRRADEISVGIMGLGVLGQHAAERLGALGYRLGGWSRNPKTLPGVKSFSGAAQFDAFLSGTDILVNLLPLTTETAGILNRSTFGKLRREVLHGGPAVINAARGGHVNELDLIASLEDGTLGAASLDVFPEEPLPGDSPLWEAPNCYLTPHVAAVSDPDAAARYVARVIAAHQAGEPLPNVVERERGY